MKRAYVFLFLCAVSCGPSEPIKESEITENLDKIQKALPEFFSKDGKPLTFKVEDLKEDILGMCDCKKTGCTLLFDPWMYPSQISRTVIHEFGHAIGLDHEKNKNSVMYKYVRATLDFDEMINQIKELCKEHECKRQLNAVYNRSNNMEIKAEGQLRHRFHGEYSAVVVLCFDNAEDSSLALPLLPHWKKSETNKSVLIWVGDSDELREIKTLLGKYGADESKIDSIKKSIDYGEKFECSFEVNNPKQMMLI
jgi:hypothetical protein